MAEKQADFEHEYECEKQRRRLAEAHVELLKAQVAYYKAELRHRDEEVRYALGDALVRAARPSLDTLKLPVRLVRLLLRGWKRRRERRAPGVSALDAVVSGPRPRFESAPLIAEPFARVDPKLRRRDDLHIAAVTDEFSWWAWQFEADVYTFLPATWRITLEEWPPDLLLIESTWRGLGEGWHNQVRELGLRADLNPPYVLPEIVAWCRQRGIPTVFYNKEDPPNFEYFIDAAKLFDFVFTSDANCIDGYRARCGHDRVFALPFAAQPRLNNPMLTAPRTEAVCFAGTWYQHRHANRQDAAPVILRPALDFGLHIYDRMAQSPDRNYQWPSVYRPALRGSLPYGQMLSAYKRYKVFLNINSVTDSPTMFARRVFELLACGTPVISAYSEGIEKLLGPDLVLMSTDEATTRKHLERLLGDDDYRARLALRGQRKVFAEHTYSHRLQAILDAIGLQRPRCELPRLTMLAAVENAADVAAAWENYRRQSHSNKALVLCAMSPAAVASVGRITKNADAVRVVVADGGSWGRALGDAVQGCAPGFIAALNPRDYYGADYLTDYAHVTLYVTEPAFGKACCYEVGPAGEPQVAGPDNEYRVVEAVNPWTLCLPREHLLPLATQMSGAATPADWWGGIARTLGRAYAADRFNYVACGAGMAPEPRMVAAATVQDEDARRVPLAFYVGRGGADAT